MKIFKHNFKLKRDPEEAKYAALNAAMVPINYRAYDHIAGVDMLKSTKDVAEKMMRKREQVTGIKIDQEETESKINMKGINDTRKKVFIRLKP